MRFQTFPSEDLAQLHETAPRDAAGPEPPPSRPSGSLSAALTTVPTLGRAGKSETLPGRSAALTDGVASLVTVS